MAMAAVEHLCFPNYSDKEMDDGGFRRYRMELYFSKIFAENKKQKYFISSSMNGGETSSYIRIGGMSKLNRNHAPPALLSSVRLARSFIMGMHNLQEKF